jgi:TIR domain/DnaJ C terminal domain
VILSGIFISYRRADSEHAAGRLADALIREFGRDQVFMDVDAIEPGVDFVERIQQALAQCRVMLVVIGDEWLTATDSKGRRRLDIPDDHVRIEVATALKRRDVRVIPLLVARAEPPGSADLPEDLAPLARRNAIELSHNRWHQDVGRVLELLELHFKEEAERERAERERAEEQRPEREPFALGPARGRDLETEVHLSADEAMEGAQKPVHVQALALCTACGGTGAELHSCRGCGGSGRTSKIKRYLANIPAGVRDGTRLRLAGRGDAGLRGGPAGDLYVIVRLR